MQTVQKISASILLLSILLFSGTHSPVEAQKGYSSASFSMGKMRSSQGKIPVPDEVRVEEYVNYHEHEIPAPENGESVNMDLRWGNELIAPSTRSSILQVGLTTGDVEDLREIPPVNVSLVIDRSGSMSGSRIQRTKEAALAFVKRLREKDRISIVTFNQEVHTLLPSTPAGQKDKIKEAIWRISAGGFTNLNAGLIEGYEQVASEYEAEGNSKVIMLTDALTNTGVVDPAQIVQNAQSYDPQHRIGISMIGVGVNFNDQLSRALTDDARTSLHFINDAADIEKVFVREVESLLSPKARNVSLELELGNGLELAQLYGYEGAEKRGDRIGLDLKRMNSGLTQVVMAKFRPRSSPYGQANEGAYQVKARLSYDDVLKEERVTIETESRLEFEDDPKDRPDRLADPEVKKNYTIAYLAQGLEEMADLGANGERQRALEEAEHRLEAVRGNYPSWNSDPDVKRVVDILEGYVPDRRRAYTGKY